MKKLLSFLAAGALALGLIGCSGDMHDELDPSSIKYGLLFGNNTILDTADICGDVNGWAGAALTKVDDTTYTYTFTAEKTEEQFSIREVAGSWTAGNRWCGALKKDNDNALKVKNGGSATLIYSDDPDPSHCYLVDLEKGISYTLTFTIEDASAKTISVALSSGGAVAVPVPYVLSGLFLRGLDATWNPVIEKCLYIYTTDTDGNVFYQFDIDYDSAIYAGFKLGSSDWLNGYGGVENVGTTIKVNDDYTVFPRKRVNGTLYDTSTGDAVKDNPDSGNIVVDGMTTGSYRIYIKTTPKEVVSVKIVTLTSVTVSGATVEVTGLPDEANGKTMYFTGSFNDWKEPGDADTISATVASNKVSIILPNFTGVFEGSDDQKFDVQAKFASTGWTKPEICAGDGSAKGENAKFTITAAKKTVKAVYKGTYEISGNAKESENGKQYCCEWTVE